MRNTTSSASSGQRAPARADPSPSAPPTFYTISTASVCVFGDRKYTGAAAVGTKVYLCAAPLPLPAKLCLQLQLYRA